MSTFKQEDYFEEHSEKGTIGMDPRAMTQGQKDNLPYVKRNPVADIRQFCIDCSGGSQVEARNCTVVDCQLWPYRMGKNVFSQRFGKKKETSE